jgi:hypothetical protein
VPEAVAKLSPPRRRQETDVAYEIRRLHDCMHSVGNRVDQLALTVDGVKADVVGVKTEVAFIKGQQAGIATRLAVPDDPDKEVKTSVWFNLPKRLPLIAAVVGVLVGLPTAFAVVSTVAQVVAAALVEMAH